MCGDVGSACGEARDVGSRPAAHGLPSRMRSREVALTEGTIEGTCRYDLLPPCCDTADLWQVTSKQ